MQFPSYKITVHSLIIIHKPQLKQQHTAGFLDHLDFHFSMANLPYHPEHASTKRNRIYQHENYCCMRCSPIIKDTDMNQSNRTLKEL